MSRIVLWLMPMLAMAGIASAQPATSVSSQFDGTWQVTVQCENTVGGVRGYRWVFFATVQNGHLHGEYGVRNAIESFMLDGVIQPDGVGHFYGHGRTGNSDATFGRVDPGSPFAYHVNAQFGPAHGTGQRVELRPCSLDFARQ